MTTLQAEKTVVMWECCRERDGETFDPTGLVTEDKAEALEELKRMRVMWPDTYLVKVVMTCCEKHEEQLTELSH